jgi:peptide/nickel transport system permease protein
MQAYFVRRVLLLIPTIIGVTIVVFGLVRLQPGNVIDVMTGEFGAFNPELKETLRDQYGLNQSIPRQYFQWLGDVLRGDLGESLLSERPVLDELKARLPVTLELGALGLLVSLLVAVPVGVISAIRQDTITDYVFRGTAIALLAIPGFWLAILIITLAARWYHWAPPLTYSSILTSPTRNLTIMAIPAILLGLGLSGGVMRLTRTQMLEVLRQDYIRTAWAKGLKERTVITRHALKNAFMPIVTMIGLQVPILVGGTVILETIFSIPGVGRYLVQSTARYDYPVIQGVNLLVAGVVIISNLLVDITYSYLDPRVRYG